MPGSIGSKEVNYLDHLRQFFDDEVADDELTALAVHAIANDIRRLKPAISQAVWDSRQGSGIGAENGTARLNEARQLQAMYAKALGEEGFRGCLQYHHDYLMQGINDIYWNRNDVGS